MRRSVFAIKPPKVSRMSAFNCSSDAKWSELGANELELPVEFTVS